jgi:hypothetical protein
MHRLESWNAYSLAHLYGCNASMLGRAHFCKSKGELLVAILFVTVSWSGQLMFDGGVAYCRTFFLKLSPVSAHIICRDTNMENWSTIDSTSLLSLSL